MKRLFGILFIYLNCLFAYAQVDQREHYFNFGIFDFELSQILDGNVKGYQYAIGDESGLIFRNFNGVAKEAIDNSGVVSNWNHDRQMYVASVSKMICTVAIMKMLENTTVTGAPTLDDKLDLLLKDYLPIRWRALIDGTEDVITLRLLLRHHSGLQMVPSNAKGAISGTMNVSLPDAFDYENANLELAGYMTIYLVYSELMAPLEIAQQLSSDAVYDSVFNNAIQSFYEAYVQSSILQPAGITAECALNINDPSSTDVYRYGGPVDNDGSAFGNGTSCIYVGWVLSATDMVNFMQKWNNPSLPGNILSQASVDQINDFPNNAQTSPLGWISNRDGYNGNIEGYGHNGIWWTCTTNSTACEVYTSGVLLLEDNLYLAINVNSNASGANRVTRTVDLQSAYNAAVCPSSIVLSNPDKKVYHSSGNSIILAQPAFEVNPADETVVFKNGGSTVLSPGFLAKSGSKFRAYVAGCSEFPSY